MTEDLSLFQEIDESLRVEKLQLFWQRSGNLVIAGCVAIVLLTAASVLWKNHVHDANVKQTDILLQAQALSDAGKYAEAAAMLEKAEKAGNGLAALARLRQAEALAAAGQVDKANAIYGELAADSSRGSDEVVHDFAALQVSAAGANANKPVEIGKAAGKNRPFTMTANEFEAVRLMRAGRNKEAAQRLQLIVGDATVPASERGRAMELLDTLTENSQ